MIYAAGLIGLIAYYAITRAILLWYAVVIHGIDLDYSNSSYYRNDTSWRVWLLTPVTGEFWFWLAGPVMLAIDLSRAFSDKMVLVRKAREAKAVTKTKLMKMKDVQLELAEIQLDKELSLAKKDYQRYHGEKE